MGICCYDVNGEILKQLYQWDINQSIHVSGVKTEPLPEFHFCNRLSDKALIVEPKLADGKLVAEVPNILLQEGEYLTVYIYEPTNPDGARTVHAIRIPVVPRIKPSDYIYEDNVSYKTELTDIRIGWDGIIYDTAGDAVRALGRQKVSLPESGNGTIGQFAVSDGKGGVNWTDTAVDPKEFITVSDLLQTPGPNTDAPMSQDATTKELNKKFDKAGGAISGGIDMQKNVINNIPDATTDYQPITYKQLKEAIAGLGTFFDLKGSKPTASALPKDGNKIGDVWFVEDESVGYIWIEKNGVPQWEKFGAPIDLSGYVKKIDIKQVTGDETDAIMSQDATTKELKKRVSIETQTFTEEEKDVARKNIGIDTIVEGINGNIAKKADTTYVDDAIAGVTGKIPDAAGMISTHNSSGEAHNDIRQAVNKKVSFEVQELTPEQKNQARKNTDSAKITVIREW